MSGGYRVKLDLTSFYSDYRRHSYILIKRDWSTVKELKEHVEKTFKISHVEFLTSDDVYLPPFESIDIINLNDEIKAIAGCNVTIPSQPKRKKLKKSKSDIEEVDSKEEGEDSFVPEPAKPAALDDADADLKSKRKRKRKRKSKDQVKEIVSPASGSALPKKLPRKTDTSGTHIHFDDDGSALDSKALEIDFVNFLDSQDNRKARIVRASVSIICNEQRNGVAKQEGDQEEKDGIPVVQLIAV